MEDNKENPPAKEETPENNEEEKEVEENGEEGEENNEENKEEEENNEEGEQEKNGDEEENNEEGEHEVEEDEEQMKPKMKKKKKKKKPQKKKEEKVELTEEEMLELQKKEEIEKKKEKKYFKNLFIFRKQQKKEHKEELEAAQKAMEEGKTIINIEMCINCDDHAWCTHHKEAKYKKKYAVIISFILQAFKLAMGEIGDGQFHVGKNLQNDPPRMGAFEIYVGEECKFSKIGRKLWPHIGLISHKIAGKEYNPETDKNRNGINGRIKNYIKILKMRERRMEM